MIRGITHRGGCKLFFISCWKHDFWKEYSHIRNPTYIFWIIFLWIYDHLLYLIFNLELDIDVDLVFHLSLTLTF